MPPVLQAAEGPTDEEQQLMRANVVASLVTFGIYIAAIRIGADRRVPGQCCRKPHLAYCFNPLVFLPTPQLPLSCD